MSDGPRFTPVPRRWQALFALAVLVSAGVEVARRLGHHGGGHGGHGYWWHSVPGLDFGFGLLGCMAIVVISKKLGKLFIQRPPGFYPAPDGEGAGDATGEEDPA